MSKKVVIAEDECTGCGMCETTCPEVFQLEGDVSKVIKPEGGPEDAIDAAIGHCLGQCISWQE